MFKPVVLLGLVALTASGCDLFSGRGATSVYGRVVDAESGEPLGGVRVAFVTSSGLAVYNTRAATITDAGGRYELAFDYEENNWPMVWTNHLGTYEEGCFLISHASTSGPSVEPGRRTEVDVDLPQNRYYDPIGQPEAYPSPVKCLTNS